VGKPVPVFRDFVGQNRIVRVVRRIIAGAKAKGEACLAVLLLGFSGLGKTTFGQAMALEYGTKIHFLYSCEKITAITIAQEAEKWAPFDFVFIDEAHRLSADAQEILYRVLVEGKVPKLGPIEDGKPRRIIGETDVPPITIVAATDQGGILKTAFKKRFGLEFHFRPYTHREMIAIVRMRAAKLKMLLSPQAARALAASCRGNPRIAGLRLQTMRHFFADRNHAQYTRAHIERLLRNLEIDNTNRTRLDRRFMICLSKHGETGVSLSSLALALSIDSNLLRTDVEPFLIQEGWVGIAPRGRFLTQAGKDLVANDLEGTSK